MVYWQGCWKQVRAARRGGLEPEATRDAGIPRIVPQSAAPVLAGIKPG
jgi:hypothetical protein